MRTPALNAWRAELASGERTLDTFDWLWRAACWEASALNAEQEGAHETARHCCGRAREITLEAIRVAA